MYMNTNERPKEPLLLREWVKYQLRLKGITFASLAKQHGARRDLPCMPFVKSYPKWERIVSAALDMKPEELWPERFAAKAAKKAYAKSTRKSRRVQ